MGHGKKSSGQRGGKHARVTELDAAQRRVYCAHLCAAGLRSQLTWYEWMWEEVDFDRYHFLMAANGYIS